MKKFILSIAILASSAAVFAQNNNQTSNTSSTPSEQVCANKDKKADCNGKKKCHGKKDKDARAFEGINLTETQKTQLTELRTNTKKERKEMKSQQSQQRKASRRAYLEGVKEILTPEQYVIYLENSYSVNSHDHKARKQGKATRGDKGGKKAHGHKHAGGKQSKSNGKKAS